jgi:hypothetical protein
MAQIIGLNQAAPGHPLLAAAIAWKRMLLTTFTDTGGGSK